MSDKLLMFKVWDYIRLVKRANLREIADVLKIEDRIIFDIIMELKKENYLKLTPIPLDGVRNGSSYYEITGKEFVC